MGTVFLASEECPVSDVYKQMIVDAADCDTVLTGEYGKKQVRCIKSPFTKAYWIYMIWEQAVKSSISSAVDLSRMQAMAILNMVHFLRV